MIGEPPAVGRHDLLVQQGAAEPLYQVERAAFHLIGAVDRQIDLAVRREGGQRDAQRLRTGRGPLGSRDPDETQSLLMTPCQSVKRKGRGRARAEPDDHAVLHQLGRRIGCRALKRVAVGAGGSSDTHGSTGAAVALARMAAIADL